MARVSSTAALTKDTQADRQEDNSSMLPPHGYKSACYSEEQHLHDEEKEA